jgi:UDP-N-acetylmuramoyl-tripeptide--D-alanyl-D-alanine ligase
MGDCAVFYGLGEGADVRAVHVAEIGAEGVVFTVEAKGERASVQLKMLGRHNVSNALAAIAVGLRNGMGLEECTAAVGEMRAGEKRGEVLEWRGATLINDSYNSNPRALDAMVDALMAMPAERHVVIAGEMLELGAEAAALHAACGRRMAERGVTVVVGVRGVAKELVRAAQKDGADAVFVADAAAAGEWLRENVRAGDAVLLKASRGVRLERALAGLTT